MPTVDATIRWIVPERGTVSDLAHLPWYHGSQQPLTVLRVGSAITPNLAIARVFSH